MYYQQLLKAKGKKYYDARSFLSDAAEYFQWCDDHPLKEEKVFNDKGHIVRAEVSRMRAYTKKGLSIFLGIPVSRLDGYRNRGGEWTEAMEMIDQIIYTQKFEGAASGLLNSNVIVRDLKLAEGHEVSGPDGKPIETTNTTVVVKPEDMTDDQLRAAIKLREAFTKPDGAGD